MNAAAPRISVCVANYNGVHLLRECLDSVLAQAGDVALELLVHDDASGDDSVAWLRTHYPQVRLLESAQNVGFCRSNNRLAAAAQGEFLLLLNNDAALAPGSLSALLAAAESEGRDCLLTLPQYDWESGALVDRGCRLDLALHPVPVIRPGVAPAYAIGACLFLPRRLWDALGGFPEWMGSIGEDLFLCLTARLRGVRVACLPRSGYRHRQGASFGGNRIGAQGLSTNVRRRFLSERNRLAVALVCTPAPLLLPLMLAHLLLLAGEGAVLAVARRDATLWRNVYGRAMTDAWQRRAMLSMLRRELQAERRIGSLDYLRMFEPWPQHLRLLWRHGLPQVGP